MTTKQLQCLLRQAMHKLARANKRICTIYVDRATGRILPRSVALEVAKAEMLLATIRRVVARPKTARKAK